MQQRYPQLQIRGENYPAPKRNQVLAKILSTVKFALLALIVLGEYVQLFQRLEIDPPSAYVWAKENKVRIPWHYFWLVSSYIWEGKRRKFYFWTPGLPEGVLSNRPCPSVVRPFVFKYLRDCSLVFSSFLHEVRAP